MTYKYDNIGKILYLNTLILVNVAFGISATSIIPEIASEMGFESLGQIIVLLQYMVGMISNIFAPTYLKKFTYRWVFFITASVGLLQCLIGMFIVVAYQNNYSQGITYFGCLLIVFFVGILYGAMWVAYAEYISENSNDQNRSLYFGISNSLCNGSTIIGSLVSIYLVKPLGEFYYFLALFFLSLATQFLYLLVKEPPSKDKKNQEFELSRALMNQSQINGNGEDSQEDLSDAVDNIEKNKVISANQFHNLPIRKQMTQIWGVTQSQKIRCLLPYMITTGVILGFEYGVYYKLISQSIEHTFPLATTSDIQVKTFIVFGVQGLMEIVGGLAIGVIGDVYLINYASIIQNSWVQIVIVITLSDCFILNYYVAIAFGMLWGFSDCAGQANCMSLLSEDWGDDIRVFGLYNFCQNLGAISAIFISIIMGNSPLYIYVLLLCFWMFFTNINLQFYRRDTRIKE